MRCIDESCPLLIRASSSTRIRTWNTCLEDRHDQSISPSSHYIRLFSGRHGIRTHNSSDEALISSEARQTVSGYLPFFVRVDRRGIEPRLPGCKPGVVPLDQQPEKKLSTKITGAQNKDLCTWPVDSVSSVIQLSQVAGPGVAPGDPSL